MAFLKMSANIRQNIFKKQTVLEKIFKFRREVIGLIGLLGLIGLIGISGLIRLTEYN